MIYAASRRHGPDDNCRPHTLLAAERRPTRRTETAAQGTRSRTETAAQGTRGESAGPTGEGQRSREAIHGEHPAQAEVKPWRAIRRNYRRRSRPNFGRER